MRSQILTKKIMKLKKGISLKKGLFLTMSMLLMVGYLVAIAGSPNPPWTPEDSDSDYGTATSSKPSEHTVYANTYVAYNRLWETNRWNVRTYHWAKVWNLTDDDDEFTFEFRHRPDSCPGYISGGPTGGEKHGYAIDNNPDDEDGSDGAWERDDAFYSYHTNPDPGPRNWPSPCPYTAIRKGSDVAKANLSLTLYHHD